MNDIEKYILPLLNATQMAAVAASRWCGLGDSNSADDAAVSTMRDELNHIDFNAKVAIGEGERDKAPMLYIGETLGCGAEQFDLAVDPLEGTNLCANFQFNSMVALAIAKRGDILNAPDVYMEKIAAPANIPHDMMSLDFSVAENLGRVTEHLDIHPTDIVVTVLDRPRHSQLIADIRKFGARIKLISDGDIDAVINAANTNPYNVNIYMGAGGAPEGVLAAAALKTFGGNIQGRLLLNDEQKERCIVEMKMDYSPDEIHFRDDMVRGECAYISTGVTDSVQLPGVVVLDNSIVTNSLVLTSWDSNIMSIKSDIALDGEYDDESE